MEFTPTEEQEAAVAMALTGKSMAIEALAGTGKTATLELIAQAKPAHETGLYMAFNKAIVKDAEAKFPETVSCRTAHSLALSNTPPAFKDRCFSRQERMKGTQMARILGIESIQFDTEFGSKRLAKGFLASMVTKGINRFCQTADEKPRWWHIPTPDTMQADPALLSVWKEVQAELEPALQDAWADLTSEHGRLNYSHGHYLKMWQLGTLDEDGERVPPRIEKDFILFDESQDASPVMLSIVEAQRDHAQLIFVGDRHQCQPTGTLVAIPAKERGRMVDGRTKWSATVQYVPIESLSDGDLVVTYRVSGSGFRLSGRPIRVANRPYHGDLIAASDGERTSLYTPNHRCLVRSSGLVGKHVVYIMRRNGQYRVGKSSFSAKANFTIRGHQEDADAIWLLSVHDTKRDALIREEAIAGRYGIPTITFRPVNAGANLDDDALESVWKQIGPNEDRAARVLAAHGRDVEYPLWRKAEPYGFMAKRASSVYACNLISGMELRTFQDGGSADRRKGDWSAVTVAREHYEGTVYSLDVDGEHDYIADGFVTFNSIYGWNGAVNAMETAPVDGRTYLTNSFRFGPEIAGKANEILAPMGDVQIVGRGKAGRVGPIAEPDIVLSRTNAVAVRRAMNEIEAGGKPHIVGGAGDVVSFAKGAKTLTEDGWTSHPDLVCFETWTEVQSYVREDELGADLKLLVTLIDDYGCDRIISTFNRQPSEKDATLILSTAHKSKGRQWDRVQLADDFPSDPQKLVGEERRLLYVASTRAMIELDAESVGGLKPPAEDEEDDEPGECDRCGEIGSDLTEGVCAGCLADVVAAEAASTLPAEVSQ